MGYGEFRTFELVSRENLDRCNAWHPEGINEWSPTDWGCAMAGEAGELCNVLKKIRRLDGGIERCDRGTREQLLDAAAQEIGGTFLYLDLLCQRLGLNMWDVIRDEFNRVSKRENLPQRLPL